MSDFNMCSPLFSDADKARQRLEAIRWPNGAVCPHCDGQEKVYALKGAKCRPGLYKCGKCRKQFTVTVGTIFEGSHIPLNKWLAAIYMMVSSKKGISANQLHRSLDITYKSAWFLCHRIRYAMTQPPLVDKLKGIVEADETYVGGKSHGKRGRGAANKTIVAALIQRDGDVRAFQVPDVKAATLKGLIRDNVDGTAQIMTDEFISYRGLGNEFAAHGSVRHGTGEYVRGIVHVNFAESYFSLLKRGIIGTFHHVSEKHMQRYTGSGSARYLPLPLPAMDVRAGPAGF